MRYLARALSRWRSSLSRWGAGGRNLPEGMLAALRTAAEGMASRSRGRRGRGGKRRLGPRLDQWTLRLMFATLALWSACLWVIGAEAFGACWAASVELAAIELAALAFALSVPDLELNLIFLVYRRFDSAAATAAQMAVAPFAPPAPQGSAGPRGLLRLMAMAAVACTVGGLITTAAISAAPQAIRMLAGLFIWPAWAWVVVRLVLAWVMMLPLALAAGWLTMVASLVRRHGPKDPYRQVTRDLLWGSAVGLAAAAGLWSAGMDLPGVALACSAVMIAAATATVARTSTGVKRSRPAEPVAVLLRPTRQRWMNLLEWAVLACVVTCQCRALRDAAGAGWSAAWLWAAGTGGLVAAAAVRQDRRRNPVPAVETAAAAAGAMVLVVIQLALLGLAAAAGRWARTPLIALAVAGQVPLAHLAATILVRRRRLFPEASLPGRFWLAGAAAGAAVGSYAAVSALSAAGGLTVLAAVALAVVAAAVLAVGSGQLRRARRSTRRPTGARAAFDQLRWAGLGAAVILAVAMVCVGLARSAREALGGPVAVGASLTAVGDGNASQAVLGSEAARAASPSSPEPVLSVLAGRLARARAGRWWFVAGGAYHPPPLAMEAPAMRAKMSFPDGVFGRLAKPLTGARRWGTFGRELPIRTAAFDGIYLAGLPADHPDAWCMYSQQVLRRCAGLLGRRGVLLVRTSAGRRGVAQLLAVAETFRSVPADAMAAIVMRGDRVEMLLAGSPRAGSVPGGLNRLLVAEASGTGPGEATAPAGGEWAPLPVAVVPAAKLVPPGVRLLPITSRAPGRRNAVGSESADSLWKWLQRKAEPPAS